MKNLFNIYHPIGGSINHKCERGVYEYEQVAVVEAVSLEDAYRKAQNHDSEYSELGVRSTCVGDIITMSDEFGTVTHHIVDSFGFIEIPSTVLEYIDWGNHIGYNEHHGQQFQQMLDNPEDYGLL